MTQRIAHPTDFSDASNMAFTHALALAVAANCALDLLHVKSASEPANWDSFPHVRERLKRWGIMDGADAPSDIQRKSGVTVKKAEINHRDGAAAGVFAYIADHPTDLIVTAPHEHGVIDRWISGSIAEQIALKTHRPTLFIGEGMAPFVNAATGLLRLDTVLVPVDHHPEPSRVVSRLVSLFASFGLSPDYEFLHIGQTAPVIYNYEGEKLPVTLADGPVVETILDCAMDFSASLIAMPTAGHDGFMDMLRGSTTERVMRDATCPLLAVPA